MKRGRILTRVFIEAWVGKRIQAELNEKNGDYLVKIDKVHILIIKSGIELNSITICEKQNHEGVRNLSGGIASIKFKGINLIFRMKILEMELLIIKEIPKNLSLVIVLNLSCQELNPALLKARRKAATDYKYDLTFPQ